MKPQNHGEARVAHQNSAINIESTPKKPDRAAVAALASSDDGVADGNGHDRAHSGPEKAAEGLNAKGRVEGAGEKEGTQRAPGGPAGGADSDVQEIADAPPAGRHRVRLLRVTLVHRSGDRGYELLLQSGPHLWRPRPLWFSSERVPPAIVARDLGNVLVPLLRAVAAPGALTEIEAAEALIGLAFTATVDATGAVTKAETSACSLRSQGLRA
jgi:hypothetical protein